jgi:hypothetical protein
MVVDGLQEAGLLGLDTAGGALVEDAATVGEMERISRRPSGALSPRARVSAGAMSDER